MSRKLSRKSLINKKPKYTKIKPCYKNKGIESSEKSNKKKNNKIFTNKIKKP